MSLLDEAMVSAIKIDKVSIPDSEGGFINAYRDGAEIKVAITFDTSIEAINAEKQGVTSRYLITSAKNVKLEYHDIIKRKSDEKIFRITSDGDDVYTPNSASLNMRQVTAEEWKL